MKMTFGLFMLAVGGLFVLAETRLRKKNSHAFISNMKGRGASKRMDRELEDSFPASDPPSWNSSVL